jgi:hypothetical protein
MNLFDPTQPQPSVETVVTMKSGPYATLATFLEIKLRHEPSDDDILGYCRDAEAQMENERLDSCFVTIHPSESFDGRQHQCKFYRSDFERLTFVDHELMEAIR